MGTEKGNTEKKKKREIKGLGDVIEVATVTLGVKKIMPKNCGCDKRRKKLNKLVPFKNGEKNKP